MRFEAITTCSAQGWKEYGERMAAAFAQHWPTDVPLAIYSEDTRVPLARTMPTWLDAFKARHVNNASAHGKHRRGRFGTEYNYRFDAVRFAHKTAVVIEAALTSPAEVLIWVDADTVTHAPVSLEFLEDLAPSPKQVISWLARTKSYPECGFYMLNLRHQSIKGLLTEWKALYTSDSLFHLPEWHDSFVLQQLVVGLRCNAKSISGGMEHTGHPFVNGPLGAVMDHMKGPRKAEGRSRKHDLKVERTEDYWKARR